jgi:hypothetical protein
VKENKTKGEQKMFVENMGRGLRHYLENTTEDVIVVRTSRAHGGGWDEVQSTAYSAGFNVYRFINKELPSNSFQECYKFVRKNK